MPSRATNCSCMIITLTTPGCGYRWFSAPLDFINSRILFFSCTAHHTVRFESTAKVLAECKLKYYRISECIRSIHHCSAWADWMSVLSSTWYARCPVVKGLMCKEPPLSWCCPSESNQCSCLLLCSIHPHVTHTIAQDYVEEGNVLQDKLGMLQIHTGLCMISFAAHFVELLQSLNLCTLDRKQSQTWLKLDAC